MSKRRPAINLWGAMRHCGRIDCSEQGLVGSNNVKSSQLWSNPHSNYSYRLRRMKKGAGPCHTFQSFIVQSCSSSLPWD